MSIGKRGMKLFLCVLALAALVAANPAHTAAAEKITKELKKWIEDEVRYIITDDERDEFDALETNREREAYVERFWAIRDPNPDTQVNEYRVEHYQRVEAANKLFRGEGKPGWMTARGKVFIVFGPPDERYDDMVTAGTGSSASGASANATDRERWIYRNPKNKILGPNAEISFLKIRDQYVLETEIDASPENLLFNARVDNVARHDDVDQEVTLKDIKIKDSEEAAAEPVRDLGGELLTSLLQGGEAPADFSYDCRNIFFPTPQEFTYVSLCFSMNREDAGFEKIEDKYAADLEIVGIVMQGENKINDFKIPYMVTETERENQRNASDPVMFTVPLYLKPGTYEIYTGLIDKKGQRGSGKKQILEVRGFDPAKLDTSSVILARKISTVPGGTFAFDQAKRNLNIAGQIEILPCADNVFGSKDAIRVFYNICGIQVDQSGQPALAILYSIIKDGETLHQLPEVESKTPIIDHPIPHQSLEPGQYTLKIVIKDNLASAQVERMVDFSISS